MKRATLLAWLTGLAVIALAVLPLMLVDGDFGGSDGVATERIDADHPNYQPWAAPLFDPPAEVSTGLFAMQAALGAGFLGYYVGVATTKRRLAGGPDPAPDED
ncbi:MAG: energy-coupling factor ABC transporter substrate-binding protein [Pseudonocardiaceae bacterium]|nr:energy-coupling factor ABC transporter substrate-binding protein [Pseudonocardiaceae bacterium]